MRNHQLENSIQQNIDNTELRQSQPGYGIVMDFNPIDNTATVLLAQPGSDMPGQFFTNVPCPSYMGIQSVAPEQGRPCWVAFRDGLQSSPVITHFFHVPAGVDYEDRQYHKTYIAENKIPRYMMEL